MFARCWQIIVRFIVDPLQGRYKDGTEPGTRDTRWFSAIPFFLRFVYFGMMLFVFNTVIIPCLTQVTVLSVILTIVSDPFQGCLQSTHRRLQSFNVVLRHCINVDNRNGLLFYNSRSLTLSFVGFFINYIHSFIRNYPICYSCSDKMDQ